MCYCSWEQNLGPKQLHLLGVENVRIPAQQPLYGGVAPKPQIKLSPIMPLVRMYLHRINRKMDPDISRYVLDPLTPAI